MSDRIPRCSRCGREDAEPPDGFAVFARRHLFGPFVDRGLCARCFSIRSWQMWRYLVAALSAIVAVATAVDGQWIAPIAAVITAVVWWWLTGVQLKALADDDGPPGGRAT